MTGTDWRSVLGARGAAEEKALKANTAKVEMAAKERIVRV